MKNWMIILLLGATSLVAQNKDKKSADSNAQIPSLESFLEQVGYSNENTVTFPHLTWEHIPELLEISRSNKIIRKFPCNPFSSQSQTECREGIVALWLIEGIRKKEKGGFPSLNPLLRPASNIKRHEGKDWETVSSQYHQVAYCRYQKWWREHGSVSEAEGTEVNPLEGAVISWY